MDTTRTVNDLIADSFTAEAAIKDAQLAYEDALNKIVQANGGATFQHNGQWFQIRTRKSEEENRDVTYLCRLKAEPKTWLKGRPKGPSKKNATTDEATVAELSNSTYVVALDSESPPSTTVIE
jgi:dGTP triphosphohydrolase